MDNKLLPGKKILQGVTTAEFYKNKIVPYIENYNKNNLSKITIQILIDIALREKNEFIMLIEVEFESNNHCEICKEQLLKLGIIKFI